jgi:hypothetical protein
MAIHRQPPKIEKWLDKVVGMEEVKIWADTSNGCMMYPVWNYYKLLKDDGVFCSIIDYEHGGTK